MDPHGSLAAEGAAVRAGTGGMGSVSPHPAHRTSRRSSTSVAQVDAAR
jgi:phosphoribosylamine-glycine ligase